MESSAVSSTVGWFECRAAGIKRGRGSMWTLTQHQPLHSRSEPRRGQSFTGYDHLELCIENCAQCKKTLGAWFDGPLCADSCLKFRGKLIPDCEDFASIAPFLTKI
ncbi:unnamed protein product [Colias eurytheme]|nr:unnamed protein product [Colias eurytheme]